MADAPPTDAPPAEGEAPPAEEAAPVEEAPAPSGPAKTWKAADKPALWKFPPAEKRKPIVIEIDEETKLSKDQLKILRDAFRIFDNEGKGNIQLEMVKEILTLLGHEVNDDELDEVMEQFDEDENGTIEFAEFIKLAEEFVEPEQEYNEAKNDLRELFVLYDKEQKGFIPVADFKLILKEIDSDLPDTEAEAIVKELDTDFSGTIEFDEFVEAMLGDDDDPRRAKRE